MFAQAHVCSGTANLTSSIRRPTWAKTAIRRGRRAADGGSKVVEDLVDRRIVLLTRILEGDQIARLSRSTTRLCIDCSSATAPAPRRQCGPQASDGDGCGSGPAPGRGSSTACRRTRNRRRRPLRHRLKAAVSESLMATPHGNAADEAPRLPHQVYRAMITSLIKRTQGGLRKSGDEGPGPPPRRGTPPGLDLRPKAHLEGS